MPFLPSLVFVSIFGAVFLQFMVKFVEVVAAFIVSLNLNYFSICFKLLTIPQTQTAPAVVSEDFHYQTQMIPCLTSGGFHNFGHSMFGNLCSLASITSFSLFHLGCLSWVCMLGPKC